MHALFAEHRPFSQRNVVAVLKALLKLRSASIYSQLTALVDGLRWIQMNDIPKLYPDEIALCRTHFDEALAKHHDVVITAGRTTKDWWGLVKNVATLAFDAEAFEVCVFHAGSWLDVAEPLTQIATTCVTGNKVFGSSYRLILHDKVAKLAAKTVEELAQTKKLERAGITAAKARFVAAAAALGVRPSAAFAKITDMLVSYRGVVIKVPCYSYTDFVHNAALALVKTCAVDMKLLPPCLCEDDLVPQPRPTEKFQVQQSLFAESVVARAAISDFAAEIDEPTGENIHNMMKLKCAVLKTMDKAVSIEIAFFRQHVWRGGASQVQRRGHSLFAKRGEGDRVG
jgi:hypothetical protein